MRVLSQSEIDNLLAGILQDSTILPDASGVAPKPSAPKPEPSGSPALPTLSPALAAALGKMKKETESRD